MSSDCFVATVAPDGSVTRGQQRWTRQQTKRKAKPGERWIFLVGPEGLRAFAPVDEVEMPPSELLDRLSAALKNNPVGTQQAVAAWGTSNDARAFLQQVLRICRVSPEELLGRFTELVQTNRVQTAQAFADWCQKDPAAAAMVRTVLEATAVGDPELPIEMVSWVSPDCLELPPIFTTGIDIGVSRNGCKISIKVLKNSTRALRGNRIRVPLMARFCVWTGPRDILLRLDPALHGAYVGIVSTKPRPPAAAPESGHAGTTDLAITGEGQ